MRYITVAANSQLRLGLSSAQSILMMVVVVMVMVDASRLNVCSIAIPGISAVARSKNGRLKLDDTCYHVAINQFSLRGFINLSPVSSNSCYGQHCSIACVRTVSHTGTVLVQRCSSRLVSFRSVDFCAATSLHKLWHTSAFCSRSKDSSPTRLEPPRH
jgi:hypothetical protein